MGARRRAAAGLGLLLVACGQPAPGGDAAARDRAAYVAAVSSPTDPNACAPISDLALQSECLAFVGQGLAQAGRAGDARRLCQTIAVAVWRSECAFLVADAGGLPVDEAKAVCGEAGQLERQCLGHLIRREAEARVPTYPVGKELEALRDVQTLAASIRPRGARQIAETIVLEHLAGRDPEARFGRQHCGALDDHRCARVYQHRVQMVARQALGQAYGLDSPDGLPWARACGGALTSARVEAQGLPGWEPEVHPIALQAWQVLCAGVPAGR